MTYFSIPTKKDQTIEWATEVLTNKRDNAKLSDVSKRLWTKELVELAVLNGKANLNVIPQEERTYELCMAALVNYSAFSCDIPAHILTHEFLVDLVSRCPRRYDMAVTLDQDLLRTKGKLPEGKPSTETYWETKEAIELALAALCPVKYGQVMLGTYDRFIEADEAQKRVLICKEHGSADHIDTLMLYKALSLLWENKKEED